MLNWQLWWTKWQPWWCYTFLNVIIRFMMPQNLTLPIKMLIVGAIVKNNITCKRMYGNPRTWIWQPLWPKTFQNHHIELCLLLYGISEGSYTPKKPVTMKLSKIRGKPQKIALKSHKNRWKFMLNWQPWWTNWKPWWYYTFLNVIIRFLMP